MPHGAIKIRPGVNVMDTPALNEAGVSVSNLIRYFMDPVMGAIIGKLGGWVKYFPTPMVAIARALWAWEDTESVSHLAVGTEDRANFQSQLAVITDGTLVDITPREAVDNVTPGFATTAGSSIVTVTDATTQNITRYDVVYIPTHVAVGGLILFGLYQCDPDGSSGVTTYTIQATDKLGNPQAAPSTSSSPAVAQFASTNGSPIITVTLAAHGYMVGDIFPILIPVSIAGMTLFNHFPVISVPTANTFTIIGPNEANATTTVNMNNGKVRFVYSLGLGPIPPGTGFGVGGFGTGGFGTGTGITPETGTPISADDWVLGNWGEALLATPITSAVQLTTTGASGTGATGTLTFSEDYVIPVGNQITVTGMTPATWNGTYLVTASATNSVSFATTVTDAQTGAGTITVEEVTFQPIYQWDAEHGYPAATAIPQAPPVNDGIFVAMPQRQIVAWGSTFTGVPDPLLIRWCDVDDFSVWIGQPTNQAGSYRLTRGSRIVGALQGPQQSFVWTDIDVWSMQYVGQPGIYSFNIVGSGCGLIGRKAAGILGGDVFWMGPSQFFKMGDAGAEILPCSVWDVIFQNMNTDLPDLIRCAPNSRFNEIAWYYAASGSTEVDSYVKFNVLTGTWDYGSLGRSAWIDQSVLGPPIGANPDDRDLYQHEMSPDADGEALAASFRTGYFAIGDGDNMTFVDQMWPDMKWGYFGGAQNATLNITFYGVDYPGDTPTTYGPYAVTQGTQFITPRIRNRLLAFQVASSDVGSWWRLGSLRYRYAPDGRF
jgi:hypothetical protein